MAFKRVGKSLQYFTTQSLTSLLSISYNDFIKIYSQGNACVIATLI